MCRHPEWNESEDLNPRPFAAKLPTRTERRKDEAEHEKAIQERDQKKALNASTVDFIEGFERQKHENRLIRIKRLRAPA
jgi:hypothetical protein